MIDTGELDARGEVPGISVVRLEADVHGPASAAGVDGSGFRAVQRAGAPRVGCVRGALDVVDVVPDERERLTGSGGAETEVDVHVCDLVIVQRVGADARAVCARGRTPVEACIQSCVKGSPRVRNESTPVHRGVRRAGVAAAGIDGDPR
jgi:hypothetical protein